MRTRLALRKTSLIDFPGRVASVLFFPGCNFRCPYCHNADLVTGAPTAGLAGAVPGGGESGGESGEDELIEVDEALAFLKRRAGLVTGAVLSGGEPLLHDGLPALARRVASLGLAVKLDTNGSFPERIREIRADYVALDLKTAPARYGLVAPSLHDAGALVVESLHLLRSIGKPYEVRITCAPGLVESADIDAIAALLEPRDEVVLQPFRPGGCLDPEWDGMAATGEAVIEEYLHRLRLVAPKARARGLGHHHQ